MDWYFSSIRMYEGRYDFMTEVTNETIVIKDISTRICDTCCKVGCTQGVSREIDAIMKEVLAGRLLARLLAAGEVVLKLWHANSIP